MDRYAVVGNPIKHSKSPWIHARFAQQTGQTLDYQALLVEPEQFESFVLTFFEQGGAGLNITVPFKERAWALAQRHSDAANFSRAVNTLYRDQEGKLTGTNTDGVGLVRDLVVNHGADLKDKRILLLGAGGAIKGVIPNLISQMPSAIVVANRTLEKAQELTAYFQGGATIDAVSYENIPLDAFDFIVNGTSAGLQNQTPPVPSAAVNTHTWCYDMLYGPGETAFQKWSKAHNAKMALDGLGMLVEQAAEAFSIWRNVTPTTHSVIEELRQLLQQ